MHGILDVEAMLKSLPQRVYSGWERYWLTEPWGPWRDNLHAALLAREVRRGTPGAKVPKLDVFMYSAPIDRAVELSGRVIAALGTIANRRSPEAVKRMRKARRDRKLRKSKRKPTK